MQILGISLANVAFSKWRCVVCGLKEDGPAASRRLSWLICAVLLIQEYHRGSDVEVMVAESREVSQMTRSEGFSVADQLFDKSFDDVAALLGAVKFLQEELPSDNVIFHVEEFVEVDLHLAVGVVLWRKQTEVVLRT